MSATIGGDAAKTPAAGDAKKLPIVDLSLDEKSAAAALREACIKFGFFYIVNHGVSDDVISNTFDQSKQFFAQQAQEKLKCIADIRISYRGYHGFGTEKTDPAKQTRGGTKEAYHVGLEHSAEDAAMVGESPQRPNLWPDAAALPVFRKSMLEYYNAMLGLGMRLLRIIALALDLDAEYFHTYFINHMSLLRLLHYDSTLSNPGAGLYACGEHCDYGVVTFLKTDKVPGLQIQWPDDTWVDVEPLDGAFIVNIGNMLERWTNDLFHSTKHRVLNTVGRERYSIPFFFESDPKAKVECLPTCCGDENPSRYEPVLAGEWLASMLSKTYSETAKNEPPAV